MTTAQCYSTTTLNMDLEGERIERTLGLYWEYQRDIFLLRVNRCEDCRTKRGLLRTVASDYDPLDFLAP